MRELDEIPPPLTNWRLDAATWTTALTTGTLAAACLTYPPLTGLPAILGPAAFAVARDLCDAVGLGIGPLLVGTAALLTRFAAREFAARITLRAVGWLILTGAAAGLADLALHPNSSWPVSAYGSGGSIGAWTAFTLRDSAAWPVPGLVLGAGLATGLTLAAGTLTQRLLVRVQNAGRIIFKWMLRCLLAIGRGLVRGVRSSRSPRPQTNSLVSPSAEVASLEPVTVSHALADTPPPMVALNLPAVPASIPPSALPAGPVPITRPAPPAPVAILPPAPASTDGYQLPSLDLLADPVACPRTDREQQLRDRAALLEKTFTDFGLTVKVVGIHTGPVITQYEIALDTGLRLSKVTTLSDDLALCLGVAAVRVVAPLPGRNTVGIEVPNDHRQVVRLKELIHATIEKSATFRLPIFIGKDVEGRPLVYDMAAMPHLLIAGRTGTGKSVCLNSVILSFLYTCSPDDCRLILIDPKKVELSEYGRIPHLMHPVVTDDKKAEAILAWAVDKMEERYELLRKARVRNIASYNELGHAEVFRRIAPESNEEGAAIPPRLPYIVIVVDEVGDLLMSMKKEVEGHIIRLAQKSRAAGIHLILATQKPTVDVITGLIKSNLPARICFQVASRADSAVVLDEKGADKLLGMGDMLFLQPGTSSLVRAQGAYVDDREIENTVNALAHYEPCYESELLNLKTRDQHDICNGAIGERLRERDPIYEQAVEIVIREQRGSTSLLQRALGIGYGKASRFIDFMHEDGVVGAFNGSYARDVLVTAEEWALRRSA